MAAVGRREYTIVDTYPARYNLLFWLNQILPPTSFAWLGVMAKYRSTQKHLSNLHLLQRYGRKYKEVKATTSNMKNSAVLASR